MIEKHLMQMSKFHLEMAKSHFVAFVLLPNSLDLVRAYWSLAKDYGDTFASSTDGNSLPRKDGDQEESPFREKFSLKGLSLIRACIKSVFNPAPSFKYRQQTEKDERVQAIEAVKQHLLTQQFVQEVMEVTVTKFFVLRNSDLQNWENDPEEWEQTMESEGESYEFGLRPCAEKLFMDVSLNYKDLLVQPLISVFQSVSSKCACLIVQCEPRADSTVAPENEEILFKDSVYTAIGLAAAVLHQQLDFDSFLASVLVAEVQKQRPGCKIVRRRTAILLGQWVTIKVSKENRPLVYQIYQHLLDPSDEYNDLVVRITAGRRFRNIVDDWEFDTEQFLPFAEPVLSRLMHLIQEVEHTETKMALLNTISVTVERLEHRVRRVLYISPEEC